jgi:hypothetical protein
LQHLRQSACTSRGARGGGGTTAGVHMRACRPMPPACVDFCLDACFSAVSLGSGLALEALCCPAGWATACGSVALHAASHGSLGIAEAVALATGCPVQVAVGRALVGGGSGLRLAWGLAGGFALAAGWHGTTQLECKAWSAIVAAGASPEHMGLRLAWGAGAWAWAAFPPKGSSVPAGAGVAKWKANVCSTNRGCSCCASNCKEHIHRGEIRVKSDADSAARWFHASCIEGGLGPTGDVNLEGAFDDDARATLAEFCDTAGGGERAAFLQAARAKRPRTTENADPAPMDMGASSGSSATGAAAAAPQAGSDADPEEDPPELTADTSLPTFESLQNFAWWDSVSYDSLQQWVPTMGTAPASTHHAVARLKGAIAKCAYEAKLSGDEEARKQAWKAFSFVDRLLYATARSKGSGRTNAQVVASRVRQAWRGDWAALWASAYAEARVPRRGQNAPGQDLQADVRAIESAVSETLLSKAVARAKGLLKVDFSAGVAAELSALFPRGAGLQVAQAIGPVSAELRLRLHAAAVQAIRRFPRRSSPGPNGSRFEHWGVLTADEEACDYAADMVVEFLLGECPAEALKANLGARLMGFRKPNGKLRPVAMGSVLRRIAAKAACIVVKDSTSVAVGPHQHGVGRPAGAELMHKSVSALVDEDPARAVLGFDVSNAFGSMPRQKILDGVLERLPLLGPVVASWLAAPTVHVYWDRRGKASFIEAACGVDQGCPLSPLFFALGLAPALSALAAELLLLDSSARLFAYLDDVYVVVAPAQAEAAAQAVERCFVNCGLRLNVDKTKAWSRDSSHLLGGSLASKVVPRLELLGASAAAWTDEDEREDSLAPVGASGADRSPVAQAAALTRRLTQLRDAGLRLQTAYTILHVFAQSCANHLQRANFEDGAWVGALDQELHRGLEALVGGDTTDTQRSLASVSTKHGGLAFGGLSSRSSTAYLGSWALCLQPVAASLGVATVEGFRTKCPSIAASMDRAEAALLAAGGNGGRAVNWLRFLQEATPKRQGPWGKEVSKECHKRLLATLPEADAADFLSHGGTGAGTWLLSRREGVQPMPDKHFSIALRDRLLLPVCREGDRCQHRRPDGRLCGILLDARGHHARKCGIGGALDARHNSIRDWGQATCKECFGTPAVKEQRIPEWDRVNPRTGDLEAAVLDVVAHDPSTGSPLYVDVVVACAHSGDPARLRARARKPGRAAADAAAGKRRRYAQAGAFLVPFALEDGGRPAEEALAFVRMLGAVRTEAEEGCLDWGGTALLWQQCSTLLQLGNAELVLSANGR